MWVRKQVCPQAVPSGAASGPAEWYSMSTASDRGSDTGRYATLCRCSCRHVACALRHRPKSGANRPAGHAPTGRFGPGLGSVPPASRRRAADEWRRVQMTRWAQSGELGDLFRLAHSVNHATNFIDVRLICRQRRQAVFTSDLLPKHAARLLCIMHVVKFAYDMRNDYGGLKAQNVKNCWEILAFLEKRPFLFWMFSSRQRHSDRRAVFIFREIWPTGNRWNRALLDKKKQNFAWLSSCR